MRSTTGRRQVHERSISGPRGAVSLSRGLARGRARKSWPRVSGTGGAGGQSPAGHVRRPSVPAEPPAAGFTCLPSGPCSPAAGQSATARLSLFWPPTERSSEACAGAARFGHPPYRSLHDSHAAREAPPTGGRWSRRSLRRVAGGSDGNACSLPHSQQRRQTGMCGGCSRVGGQIQPRERASWTASCRLAAPSLAAAEER
jgi:hypothetical protein